LFKASVLGCVIKSDPIFYEKPSETLLALTSSTNFVLALSLGKMSELFGD